MVLSSVLLSVRLGGGWYTLKAAEKGAYEGGYQGMKEVLDRLKREGYIITKPPGK